MLLSYFIFAAAAALLALFLYGVIQGFRSRPQSGPPAQPTESEAIVAALREEQEPLERPLAPPSMLPVDKAAQDKGR
jgi:hypothetical protein